MRRIIAASVLLSPLFISAAALASQPVTVEPASTATHTLSTGIKPVRVLSAPDVDLNAEVVLSLNVDEKGNAQDVQVIKSPTHYLDAPVADAVRQYRFSPAMLDNQPVSAPITLTVVVQR